MTTVAGGMITAAAVVFWIRATMAQMAASQFSAVGGELVAAGVQPVELAGQVSDHASVGLFGVGG